MREYVISACDTYSTCAPTKFEHLGRKTYLTNPKIKQQSMAPYRTKQQYIVKLRVCFDENRISIKIKVNRTP